MLDAFLGGDEADFGSCHHAEADLDGVGSAVTAELRGETAATEFSYDSGEDEEGSEDEHIPEFIPEKSVEMPMLPKKTGTKNIYDRTSDLRSM